jgi:hypothetical protein
MRPTDKSFTEREVGTILRRAAELQERAGDWPHPPQGSSTEEVERIADEVGIDRRYVQAAISELHSATVDADQKGQIRWLGAPEEYTIERTVSGSLTDEVWASLEGTLNAHYKQSISGVVSGNVRTWNWKHELGFVHLAAVQASDGVRLKLTFHIDDGIVAGLIPTVIAGFAGTTILFAADALRPWLSILLSGAWAALLAFGFRRTAARWWRRDRKKNAALMERLVETAFDAPQESRPVTTEQPASVSVSTGRE